MQWYSLVATALGAVIAFSGSALSEVIRSRRDDRRNSVQTKHQAAIEFILSANRAHSRLRLVARNPVEPSQLEEAAREAVGSSGLYDAREHMLISASPGMAFATEKAFFSVMGIRDTIMSNSHLDSPAYLQARKDFDQAIWGVRQAARKDIGNIGLDLDEMVQVETLQPSSE